MQWTLILKDNKTFESWPQNDRSIAEMRACIEMMKKQTTFPNQYVRDRVATVLSIVRDFIY